jgi:integrase
MSEKQPPKIALVTEDCFAAVVRVFLESGKFRGYSDATRELWGRELQCAAHPDYLGAISVQSIRPALVQAYLDGLEGRPGKQTAALAALKQLEKYAVVRDILPRQITLGVATERPDGGHTPWTEEQVALGERYAKPEISRVITLAANTGQRGSDLVRMGPTDIETYQGIDGINVKQRKTGKVVWIPISSRLAEVMRTWERRPGPFLTRHGKPYARKQLTDAWTYELRSNAALAPLRGLVLHGLRGFACVTLKRSGATTAQIADMVGMSEPMVAKYCRLSVQRENATAAIYNIERTLRERKIDKSEKSGG